MKLTLIYIIVAFFVVSTNTTFGQDESKKADSLLVKSKPSDLNTQKIQTPVSNSETRGETQSSGVVKPEPVIIYRDDEKILVQPKK